MTSDESLANAVRQRSRLGDAMQELEEAAAAPAARESWTADLLQPLRGLEAAFNEHIADVQAPGALLDRIIDEAPRLQRAVEVKKAEHLRIAQSIGNVVAAVSAETASNTTIEIRDLVMDLLMDVARHRQQGADLIYDAYDIDIGGY